MNCKQGDLAIVVKSYAGNEGKIVRCLRLIGYTQFIAPDGVLIDDYKWEIDTPLKSWGSIYDSFIADSQLRPIRDPGDDAQDETLQWLDVPSKETV